MKNLTPNSWAVELHCPQCGAPVTLGEADRILSCAFCRVRLLIGYKGFPKYLLAPFQDRTIDQDFFYIPYWRIRGMAFDTLRVQGKDRIIDATFLALEIPGLPLYLGLQARAFKLHFLSAAPGGRFLEPWISFEEIWSRFLEDPSPVASELELETTPSPPPAFIGETVSQVFAPFYFKAGMIFDGLGDRPLGKFKVSDYEKLPLLDTEALPKVRFLPVICPYCGADLQGEKDTWVLPCRNCDRVWDFDGEKLSQIDFNLIDSGNNGPLYFLPFWRINPADSLEGLFPLPPFLASAAHNLKKDPAGGKGEKRYYWLPAFKLSPSAFLTASRAMTLRQPLEYRGRQDLPQGQYYPVNLPWEQAVEGLPVLSAHLTKSPISSSEFLSNHLKSLDHLLIFVPFHLQGSELVQETLSLGISRAALHFGRFI
ncbi:MAG: hypothetical protein AB1585_16450 [Thermodesulfobacteriota bacterium]